MRDPLTLKLVSDLGNNKAKKSGEYKFQYKCENVPR